MVEHAAVNRRVAGSSPARGAICYCVRTLRGLVTRTRPRWSTVMDEDLLHHPAEQVLLLRVRFPPPGPSRTGPGGLPASPGRWPVTPAARAAPPDPASRASSSSSRARRVLDLLVAEAGLELPRLERLEVAIHGRLGLGGLRSKLPDLLLESGFSAASRLLASSQTRAMNCSSRNIALMSSMMDASRSSART